MACAPLYGQSSGGSNSPHSRYGLGTLSDDATGFNKGMAGTGYAFRNNKEVNPKNPASYSAVDSLTFLFDMGITLQSGRYAQGSSHVNANNATLDYIVAAFRLMPRLGLSLGLQPYTNVGYSLSTESNFTYSDLGEVTRTDAYDGDGGTRFVYLGLGWEPFRGLSIGANAGYLWGSYDHEVEMSYSESTINTQYRLYSGSIRTWKADFGLQYELRFKKKRTITLGLTYSLGHDIGNSACYVNQRRSSSSVQSGDTLRTGNAFALPHEFGAGLAWADGNHWRVGVDYTFSKWAEARFPSVEENNGVTSYTSSTGSLLDRHKISAGVEYIPNPNGIYWRNHIRYRAGFSFATPYTKEDGGDGPNEYLATIGVAIPLTSGYSNRSLLNVSVFYKRYDPQISGGMSEQYIGISLGISFNERWFMKWKVD